MPRQWRKEAAERGLRQDIARRVETVHLQSIPSASVVCAQLWHESIHFDKQAKKLPHRFSVAQNAKQNDVNSAWLQHLPFVAS